MISIFFVVICMLFLSFLEEEINNMKIELEKYNIQMPAFSKIGGILANELSVDEAACEHCFSLLKSNSSWHFGTAPSLVNINS